MTRARALVVALTLITLVAGTVGDTPQYEEAPVTDPTVYWTNNSGPPYLGPTGLHAWATAILDTAQTQTADDIADITTDTRQAIDAVIAAAPTSGTAPTGGVLADALADVNTTPVIIVTTGDSTASGTHVTVADQRWHYQLTARIQAAFPLATGSHPSVVTLAAAVSSPPTTPGVHMVSAGVGSTTAADYITSTTGPQIGGLNPDLVLHMVGVNDFYYDVATATYKANIQDRVAELNAASATTIHHMLIHVHEAYSAGILDGTAHAWEEYGQAMAEIAGADANVSYLDLDESFKMAGRMGTSDPNGLVAADAVHMTISGHTMSADLIGDALVIPRYPAPEDTGWVDITPGSGWGATAGYTPRVRREGNRVVLTGAVTRSGTSGALTSIALIPDGFYPGTNTFLSATVTNGGAVVQPYASTAGVLASASGYISGSLASGAVLPLAGTWFVN